MAVNPSFDERASPYGLRANAFPADSAIVGNRHACFEKRLSLAGVAWRQVAKQNYRQGNPLRAGAGLGRACAGALSPRVRGTLARPYHPYYQHADGYKTDGEEGHQYTAAFLGGGAPESVGVCSSDAGSEGGDDEGSVDVAGF